MDRWHGNAETDTGDGIDAGGAGRVGLVELPLGTVEPSVAQPGSGDAGMSTVEYAVGTVVAAAFAAVLYRIVTGDSIVAGLTSLIQSALNTSF